MEILKENMSSEFAMKFDQGIIIIILLEGLIKTDANLHRSKMRGIPAYVPISPKQK